MAEPTTVGELNIFAQGIKEHLTSEINNLRNEMKAEFKEVKDKQDKTNGRVKRLEIWRAYIVGALAVLNTIVYPVVLIYVQNHIK